MHRDDLTFLERLGGAINSGTGSRWRYFQRNGRVLLVLPDNFTGARLGAELYSPQRRLAKWVSHLFLKWPLLWRLLPSFTWELAGQSPAGKIFEEAKVDSGVFLLGNPVQPGRRSLLALDGGDGGKAVVKIGIANPARDLVRDEARLIENFAKNYDEISPLVFICHADDWSAFAMPFLEDGNFSLREISNLLSGWLGTSSQALKAMPSWSRLKRGLSDDEIVKYGDVPLRTSLVHGDLAPWNLRTSVDGGIAVIDWEDGRPNDVPGWDLVHYLFQRAWLVHRLDEEGIFRKVLNDLCSPETKAYVKAAGWAGEEIFLFKSYLIAMASGHPHIPRLLQMADQLEGDEGQLE